MKKLFTSIVCVFVLAVSLSAALYKFEGVKRVDSNLYRSSDRYYIQTRLCLELPVYEDVIYDDEKRVVYFENGAKCDVVRIFK